MRIPFKMSQLKVRHTKVKWIIIHHSVCQYPAPESRIDNPKFQLQGLANGVLEQKMADINYHYVIDKIKEDYQVLVCRPFVTLCEYPDIDPNINKKAIHVALLGSYDFKIPQKRCYNVLAYRLLNPFMKMYGLNPKRILFHNQVSKNKDLTCPGDFIDKAVIEAMVRKYVIK